MAFDIGCWEFQTYVDIGAHEFQPTGIALPAVTVAASGTVSGVAPAGTAAVGLPTVTVAATGAVQTIAQGAAGFNLPGFTQTAVGSVNLPTYTGTAAIAAPPLLVFAEGLVDSGAVTGTAALDLPALTIGADGVQDEGAITGTADIALSAITVLGTPDMVGGPIASDLPAATAALAGDIANPITGTIVADLPAVILDAVQEDPLGGEGVTRLGPFGFPVAIILDPPTEGGIDATLVAVTAALSGTVTQHNFGTLAGTASPVTAVLTGAVVNPVPVTGTLAGTLTPLTAALAGGVAGPITGTLAASLGAVTASASGSSIGGALAATLPAATAALSGVHAENNDAAGLIASSLSSVTAALIGTHTPPAVTGTIAATLPTASAALEGSGGAAVDVAFPEGAYRKIKRRRERLLAEQRALNKRIRQRLGLEPPDPEPEQAIEGPQAPEPFYVSANLGLMPLLERMGQLRGELAGLEAEHDAATAEMALRAILLADDAAPSIGEIDLSMLEEQMPRPGASELILMTGGAAQPFQEAQTGIQATAQAQAQTAQMLSQAVQQMGQAIQALMQSQQELIQAVKAPRRKSMTVRRGRDGRVQGAEVLEEAE